MKRSGSLALATVGAAALFVAGISASAEADTDVTERVSDYFEVTHGTMELNGVACPTGKEVVGGGYSTGSGSMPGFDIKIVDSLPGMPGNGSAQGWMVQMKNYESSADVSIYVYAICVESS